MRSSARSGPGRWTTPAFPYVYLDATYLHVRNKPGKGGQVVSMAVVVATGIAADGSREVLGLDVGDSEDETFWRAFLLSLKQRGLAGVQLVISDQHSGLVAALKRSFQGSAHQRCRVHFARNLLAHVPKSHADMVAAVFRTIFAQPDPEAVNAGVGRGPRPARRLVPEGRAADGRREGRGPRVHRLPQGPLAQDLVDQPPRAGQQGDQAPQPGRRDLPQRRRRDPARRRGPDRHARRMDRRRPPLPIRGVHGAAQRPPWILEITPPSRAASRAPRTTSKPTTPRGSVSVPEADQVVVRGVGVPAGRRHWGSGGHCSPAL